MDLNAVLIALALAAGLAAGSLWRGRRMASEHRAREDSLTARIDAAEERAARSDAAAADATDESNDARDALVEYRAQHELLMSEHASLQARHDSIRDRLASLEAGQRAAKQAADPATREEQVARLAAAAAGRRITELSTEVETLRTKASRLQTELASARAATAEVERDTQAEHARLAAELSNARWELQTIREDREPTGPGGDDTTARLKLELRESRVQIHALRNQVAELEAHSLLHVCDEERRRAGDDLERINGIGPKFRARLNEIGVTSFHEIAMWSDQEAVKMSEVLDTLPRRVIREQWREQAARLAAGAADGE